MFSQFSIAKLISNKSLVNLVKSYSYKSSISLENLYPKSDLTKAIENPKLNFNKNAEEFSGYIPIGNRGFVFKKNENKNFKNSELFF